MWQTFHKVRPWLVTYYKILTVLVAFHHKIVCQMQLEWHEYLCECMLQTRPVRSKVEYGRTMVESGRIRSNCCRKWSNLVESQTKNYFRPWPFSNQNSTVFEHDFRPDFAKQYINEFYMDFHNFFSHQLILTSLIKHVNYIIIGVGGVTEKRKKLFETKIGKKSFQIMIVIIFPDFGGRILLIHSGTIHR